MLSYSKDSIPEAIVDEPSAATGLGYSRSKWVAEMICDRANNQTALRDRVSVFRVGQLAGDSHRGIWNTKEAWPMMLSLVKVTGTLPDLANETLDWLPVDIAATALTQGMASVAVGPKQQMQVQKVEAGGKEVEQGSGALTDVVHVVNDRENPTWRQMLRWLQKERDFEVVNPSEWVSQLERAEEEKGDDHPAFQLVGLWKKAYGSDDEEERERDQGQAGLSSSPTEMVEQRKVFVTEKTKAQIPALCGIAPVDEQYFLKIWRWIDENM